jgi:hypothetical protein
LYIGHRGRGKRIVEKTRAYRQRVVVKEKIRYKVDTVKYVEMRVKCVPSLRELKYYCPERIGEFTVPFPEGVILKDGMKFNSIDVASVSGKVEREPARTNEYNSVISLVLIVLFILVLFRRKRS